MIKYLLAPLAAAVLLAAGCSDDPAAGYSLKSQYRSDVRTVAVPIFQRHRDIYRRDIEFELTEAIVKRIELDTPYKVVSRGQADTELTGTIERIDQHIASFDPDTGRPRELLLTITVSYAWKDLRAGRAANPQIAGNPRLKVTGYYVTHEPVGEDFFVGEQDVINRLARRIVESMEAPW
jgi:hypothetical protein